MTLSSGKAFAAATDRATVLTAPDACILQLLRGGASPRRVADVGRYRDTWTVEDVDRVIRDHLAPPQAGHNVWQPTAFGGIARNVRLTRRQSEILDGLCAGATNADLALAGGVSEDTVKTLVKQVLRRLQATSRSHAAVLVLTGRVRVLIPRKHGRNSMPPSSPPTGGHR
jgi:DNA-binding CsgD family transcriptional regulator